MLTESPIIQIKRTTAKMNRLFKRLDKIQTEKANSGNVFNLSWMQEDKLRQDIIDCRNTLRQLNDEVTAQQKQMQQHIKM